QLRALFIAENLPGHDVGVVLHGRDQDLVTAAHVDSPVSLRHQVDSLGSATNKNEFFYIRRIDEAAHRLACTIMLRRRELREKVNAAMNVGIFLFVIARDRVDDRSRLLRCSSVIEVDQFFSTNVACQDRKVTANSLDIKAGTTRSILAAGFGGWDFGRSGHPISSTFLPRSSFRATVESGLTELAISKR